MSTEFLFETVIQIKPAETYQECHKVGAKKSVGIWWVSCNYAYYYTRVTEIPLAFYGDYSTLFVLSLMYHKVFVVDNTTRLSTISTVCVITQIVLGRRYTRCRFSMCDFFFNCYIYYTKTDIHIGITSCEHTSAKKLVF